MGAAPAKGLDDAADTQESDGDHGLLGFENFRILREHEAGKEHVEDLFPVILVVGLDRMNCSQGLMSLGKGFTLR